MILVFVRSGFLDHRRNRAEQVAADALRRVADVFRDQRQQDLLATAIRHPSGQQVEQEEKRRLPARRDGDVFRAEIPAEALPEESGDGL